MFKSFISPAMNFFKRRLQNFKALSRRKKILLIVCVGIVLIIVLVIVQNSLKPPVYTIAKVSRGNVSEVVSETGSITTGSSSTIYSPTTGVIDEIFITNGDRVDKGQKLFTVTSTASEQEQSAASSTYLIAKAALNAAESNANLYRSDMYAKWKTYRDMATSSTYETDDEKPKETDRLAAEFQIAQDNWKAAEAKYKDQETAIAQARAQTNSAWLLYQSTQNATVNAPIGGTITNLAFSPGGSVQAYSQTGATPPVLAIVNFTTTEAVVALNELDATKTSPGQPVSLDVSAVDGKKYQGVVVRVDDIGTVTQGVTNYRTYVRVTNPDRQLKSGMTVEAEIVTKKRTNVLLVPNAAVKPYKGGRAVRILDPKSKNIIYKMVTIGIKGKTQTEIVNGLVEGQEIIISLTNDQIKRPGLF